MLCSGGFESRVHSQPANVTVVGNRLLEATMDFERHTTYTDVTVEWNLHEGVVACYV